MLYSFFNFENRKKNPDELIWASGKFIACSNFLTQAFLPFSKLKCLKNVHASKSMPSIISDPA